MTAAKPVIVQADIITPYGKGIAPCWNALLGSRSAVSPLKRFEASAFSSSIASTISDLEYLGDSSLVMQMLERLFSGINPTIPQDSALYLATIKGEIDFLERSVLSNVGDPADCNLYHLLGKVGRLAGTGPGGLIISAACTSSLAAIAQGAAAVRRGEKDSVLVVGCDAVTEFIFSGFSSLMALNSLPAKPFDRNREGLSLGEAAAYLLVMSEERALREDRIILAEIAGWGLADDANHMTGPSREAEGLIKAIKNGLKTAGCTAGDIGFISAHGTGTMYNDAMEMRAFRSVFMNAPLPVYSVKGALGHTMGAAGLLETVVVLEALREGVVPPTVNLTDPDDDAIGWVSESVQRFPSGKLALVSNAGFSGVNTALILKSRQKQG